MVSFFATAQQETIDQKVNALLKKMTIEEKIGPVSYTHLTLPTTPYV